MSKEARLLFVVTYVLVAIGIVMIYSASGVLAHDWHGNEAFFLIRQVFYVLLGTIGFFIAASLPLNFYKQYARAFMLMAIMLLMSVYLPVIGHSAGGARRWLHFGPLQFQPVEFAKLACCIYLADYLGRKIAWVQKGDVTVFFPPLIMIGLVCGLTILEPDLGSVAFYGDDHLHHLFPCRASVALRFGCRGRAASGPLFFDHPGSLPAEPS